MYTISVSIAPSVDLTIRAIVSPSRADFRRILVTPWSTTNDSSLRIVGPKYKSLTNNLRHAFALVNCIVFRTARVSNARELFNCFRFESASKRRDLALTKYRKTRSARGGVTSTNVTTPSEVSTFQRRGSPSTANILPSVRGAAAISGPYVTLARDLWRL